MLKKNLLLLLITCLLPLGLNAQELTTSEIYGKGRFELIKDGSALATPITNQHIEAGEGETWWGYFDGDTKNARGFGVGDNSEVGMTYNCAIFIPGDHPMGKGRIIKAIRFYFASAASMSDIKVWMSKKLPDTADLADIEVKNVPYGDITDGAYMKDPVNDVAFDKPYTIDEEGVFVGYSFTMDDLVSMQDLLPVVTSVDPNIAEENSNFICVQKGKWKNYAGYNYGNLAIRVLMQGEFDNNVLDIQPTFDNIGCVKNGNVKLNATLVNMGGNSFDNFSYVVSVNGKKSEEKVYNIGHSVSGIGTKVKCVFPLEMGGETGTKNVNIEITKVGGQKNISTSNIMAGKVLVLTELVRRKIVLEEYTGTWAQWAPRGYVGLEKSREEFDDDVVITNIHFGQDDPMICTDYNSIRPNTAPNCNVSREIFETDSYYGSQYDDYYGMGDIIDDLQKVIPVAKVEAVGVFDKDSTKVMATSKTTFLYSGNDADYAVAYVLQINGLKGDTPEWTQKNILANFNDGSLNFEPLYKKWVEAEFEITDMVYNDVAIATRGIAMGVEGSVSTPFKEGEAQDYTVEFDLNNIGELVQNKNNLYLCVYLIDKTTGHIVNADYKKVIGESDTAIRDIDNASDSYVVKRYSIDGTELNAPVKGINLLKYSDGRIVKVLVK